MQVPTANGALFTVPDLIEEQLGYPDTSVAGPMLYLSPERAIAGASDGEGAGHEGEVMHVWRDEGRSDNCISAAGPFVRPCPFQLQPCGIDGQLLPVLLESALRDIMDELLAKHDAMAHPGELPDVRRTSAFPYRGLQGEDGVETWPFSLSTPVTESDEVVGDLGGQSDGGRKQCNVCKARVLPADMRGHVGAHILSGRLCPDSHNLAAPHNLSLCGFCGQSSSETTCKVTLTSKRGGAQATVACSSFTKFNYASAAKYSKSSPCTNVPRVCGVCPGGNTIVWSYDYLNHLQLKHAERSFTLDEIEKNAITVLECREVLNKYLGISFEKVFLPKLKVQVGLLRDTSEVALFWKKVLGDS
eukprot:jgi/Mesvir1/11101/Mv02469-RA.1